MNIQQKNSMFQSFLDDGYCICNAIVDPESCDQLRNIFESEIKPYNKPLRRQISNRNEHHNFSSSGHMTNPILDAHIEPRIPSKRFQLAIFNIFNSEKLLNTLSGLFRTDPILLRTAYYESSKGTLTHADHPWLDGKSPNRMIGSWVALEDITDESGPFYVYPKTHSLTKNNDSKLRDLYNEYSDISIRASHEVEKNNGMSATSVEALVKSGSIINSIVKLGGFQKTPLRLEKGDAIVFSANLLHGSLKPKLGTKSSRNSISGFFIPDNELIRVRGSKIVEPDVCIHASRLRYHANLLG